jgi:hypothetical protein
MTIWQVWDGDYDGDWVVATYDSEALALDHAETFGLSRVEAVEVASVLAHDAADVTLREERKRQREADAEKARRNYEEQKAREASDHEWRQSITIDQMTRPGLCHCRTFSADQWFISPHGYCSYCGGWTPEVFRAARGETALAEAIALLDIHNRTDMLAICGLSPSRSGS